MKNGKQKFKLLLGALLSAALLWGCGSSGSGGSTVGTAPDGTLVEAQVVGSDSCKVCHSLAHTSQDSALVGSIAPNALMINHECENCHGGGQYHRGLGPIPNPSPTIATCAACHSGAIDKLADSGLHENTCLTCHEPLKAAQKSITKTYNDVEGTFTGCAECHTAKTATELQSKPFTHEIAERVAVGRHVGLAGNPRANNCAACHSHEGALLLLSKTEKANTIDDIEAMAAELAALGGTSDLTKKTCATCHDPHQGTLRGIGDVKETFTLASGLAWERTVYSAEFNLCTSCHQVNLETTWNPAGGYSNAGVIEYALAGAYTKSLTNADPYSSKQISYHANSYQARSFVDTHFAGELYKKLYYYDIKDGVDKARKNHSGDYVVTDDMVTEIAALEAMEAEYLAAPDNVAIKGFGVNPGSANACTACHDAHSANKMVKPFTTKYPYAKNFEAEVKQAITFGQGVGHSHGDHTAWAFARNVSTSNGDMYASANCTPCHVGRDFVKMTYGADKADLGAPSWNVVACVSCHDMAQPFVNDTTAPRAFPAGKTLAFNDGTELAAADLGANQVCFECHKGRTPYDADPTLKSVYGVGYLHYKPQFAILEGVEGMIPSYEGKDYTRDWEGHYHVTSGRPTTCVGCHDIHTEYNRVGFDSVLHTNLCSSCHYTTDPAQNNVARSFNVLKARTAAFADVLAETMLSKLAELVATDNDAAIIVQGVDGANVTDATVAANVAKLMVDGDLDFSTGTELALQKKRLKVYITGSSRDATGSRMPNNALATAGAIWKNFNYDDKGGWAHNSILARQSMYDAIVALDDTMLALVPVRFQTKLDALGIDAARATALNLMGSTANGSLLRYLSAGATVRTID